MKRPALVVALLAIVPALALRAQTASVSGPPMELDAATTQRLLSAMAQDLIALVAAQDAIRKERGEYADNFQRGAIKGAVLRPSPGVTVTLTYVTKQTYAARATHDWLPGRSCVIKVGAVASSRMPSTTAAKHTPTRDRVPVCDAK